MSKIPVSVCIIAKNEEAHIGECLSRLFPYGMELVVTDTGSSDRTREIALQYTDRVYDYEWTNDFAAARNYCASHASNNWILALDCDEYVQSIDMDALRATMQYYSQGRGIIKMDNVAYGWNSEEKTVRGDVVRFYNKSYYEFKYPVHEEILPKRRETGKSKNQEYFYMPMKVLHVGYLIPPEEMQAKQERNLTMLYEALDKDEERRAYWHYQIGQSEHVLRHLDAAIEHYEQALELESDSELGYIQTCIEQLAITYAQNDQPDEAAALMERYAGQVQTARFKFTYAKTLMVANQPLKALLQLVLASVAPDSDKLSDEEMRFCLTHIIRLYTQFGQPELARPFRERLERLQLFDSGSQLRQR